MQNNALLIRAIWDKEAAVWVAESDEVPGLITEAESEDALLDKLRVMVPELLELNHRPADNGPLEVLIQFRREERISFPVAA
jgi:predicted RNase H-like HicB family nuclease